MLRNQIIDRYDRELLRNACEKGHIRIVKYVHNDNISFGDGLYVLACEHGHSQIVKIIYPYIHDERYLNYGLLQAIKHKYYKTVVLLLKLGANPNYDDEDDGLAILEAINNNDIWTIRLMIKYGTNVSSINFSKKTYSKIKDLIDKQTQNVTV
jgi:ankyrin repeat protein